MEQCNLYWIWQHTHLTVCLQYSTFTVCFQTELKPKSDIITNLSGHCNSGILPNNSMSETLSSSHTGVPHDAGGEQDTQVLDGAAQPLCLHLTVQMAILMGLLREGVSGQNAHPLSHLLLHQQHLSGAAMIQRLLCEATIALDVFLPLQ